MYKCTHCGELLDEADLHYQKSATVNVRAYLLTVTSRPVLYAAERLRKKHKKIPVTKATGKKQIIYKSGVIIALLKGNVNELQRKDGKGV